jgi:YHS domain-containing protein
MNKTIKISLGLMAVCGSMFLMACGDNSATTTDTTTTTMDSTVAEEDSVISYDISLVNNKKDPTCGMPVTAGISDTAHYENKVLGFCSAGCKEEFLKNPKANIAAAEMK